MTLSEFKAWLDGFSAAINGAPSADQWAAIQAKLATVTFSPEHSRIVAYPVPMPSPTYPLRIGDVTCQTIAGSGPATVIN